MTYTDAARYCDGLFRSKLLHLDNLDDLLPIAQLLSVPGNILFFKVSKFILQIVKYFCLKINFLFKMYSRMHITVRCITVRL